MVAETITEHGGVHLSAAEVRADNGDLQKEAVKFFYLSFSTPLGIERSDLTLTEARLLPDYTKAAAAEFVALGGNEESVADLVESFNKSLEVPLIADVGDGVSGEAVRKLLSDENGKISIASLLKNNIITPELVTKSLTAEVQHQLNLKALGKAA